MRWFNIALAAFALAATDASAQATVGELVGRVCTGTYEIRGAKGLNLTRFLPVNQAGMINVERYRITDRSYAALSQASGGAYDIGFPDRIRISDWELLATHPATLDPSKAGGTDYPIVGQSGQNEWRARLLGDQLTVYAVQWDRSDPKLSGVVGIPRVVTQTCNSR